MPKQDENGYVYNDYGNIVYEKKQPQEVPASDIVYDTYDFQLHRTDHRGHAAAKCGAGEGYQ